jgi:hypothetical protein
MRTYLTEKCAGQYTGVSDKYLRKLRCVGGGPVYVKVGRRVVYDQADLDAWLDSLKVKSTSDASRRANRRVAA